MTPNVYAPPLAQPESPSGVGALSCPHCDAAARTDPRPQQCGRCRKWFTLRAGPALDGNVAVPPFDPATPTLGVRWSAVVAYKYGTLDPVGITEGMLDPVVALQSISQTGVAFPDILSIAVWRKLDWVAIVVAILVLPIALACLAAAFAKVWGLAIFGLGAALLVAYLGYRGIAIGRCYVRVRGRYTAVTIRFDQPARKRRAFHDELFRRAGLTPPPLP